MISIGRRSAQFTNATGHMITGGFHVQMGVWPVALGHHTGVVWTPDQWHSVNWTDGHWVYNDDSGSEVWEADVDFKADHPVKFWYALFVIDTYGYWSWDNNGGWNYETKGPDYAAGYWH